MFITYEDPVLIFVHKLLPKLFVTLHILLKLHKHIRLILIIILQVYQCLETQYHIQAFSYFQLQGLRDFVLCTKTKHTLCNPLKMIDPLMDFTKINIYYSSILITEGETFGFRFITLWFVMFYRCHIDKPKPKDNKYPHNPNTVMILQSL